MPNGAAHQLAGIVTGVGICLLDKDSEKSPVINPLTAGLAGGFFGKLPDYLEPASHPNHRQFFHGVAVLGALGYGLKKVYDWEPETEFQRILRGLALIGGGAYASHLILDSLTPKSLPMIGKI